MPTLSTLLQTNRRRFFVGREAELTCVEQMLDHPVGSPHLLYCYGPGGMGKSTLLAVIHERLEQRCCAVLALDGRDLPPVPVQLQRAIDAGLTQLRSAHPNAPLWVSIDSFEHLAALQGWFHEVLLPQMSTDIRWVFSSRQPPDPRWRANPAWRGLMHCMELRALSADEADRYLERRGLDAPVRRQVNAFAQGYPLALAMSADLCRQENLASFHPRDNRELLQNLALQFITEARTPARATAIQVLALTKDLSEPLLAAMLPDEPAPALYDWLSELSFVYTSPRGLAMHDLISQSIAADVRSRDTAKSEALIYRGEEYLLKQLQSGATPTLATVHALTYLARQGELSDRFHTAAIAQPLYPDGPRPGEVTLIRDLVARHQGAAQLARFDAWYARQPAALTVFRDYREQLCGFALFLQLTLDDQALLGPTAGRIDDPWVDRVLTFLRSANFHRAHTIDCCHFWMDTEQGMGLSSTMANTMMLLISRAAERTAPGACALVLPDEPLCRGVADVAEHHCLDCPGDTVDDQPCMVTVHDWSDEAVGNWLVRTNRRVRSMQSRLSETAPAPLSREQLRSELKKVLRHFHDDERIKQSPLLAGPLGGDAVATEARINRLREQILDVANRLNDAPKTEHYYAVLQQSYFRPAKNRLDAASRLNMAPSTYYRHLAKALDLLSSALHRRHNAAD